MGSMARQRIEPVGEAVAVPDAALDRVASAVHHAAYWLPPWSDPMTLVVAAGFQLVVCPPDRPAVGARRVGFEWDARPELRGLRVLAAFARVLLREVVGLDAPDTEAVTALAARLLIPPEMLGAARRDPDQPARHAPRAFVMLRLGTAPVTQSGTFAARCAK